MWGCINKISSLEEKAWVQVAINLCQENGFKEVAMRLEKPTYGCFIGLTGLSASARFASDPQTLSMWDMVKENDRVCNDFVRSYCLNDTLKAFEWDTAVDEQCQILTEGIPNRFKQNIHPLIGRMALEYLSYSRRQEVLFGVSRYFLMDILTRGDWKAAARLDEMKLAQRLLEDERLTVLQRYRIACVYCLHVHIPQLWERLTQDEKRFTSGDGKCGLSEETHSLVLLWSRYMNTCQEEKVAWPETEFELWTVASQVVSYGNCAVVMVCWNAFPEGIRQKSVIDIALECVQQWQSMEEFKVKNSLVSYQCPEEQSSGCMQHFNLPSYYSELMFFFLSCMDEEQQLTFFAFQRWNRKSVLECFLDWPHQDYFLPTINCLWGMFPKDTYAQCLLALANKYSGKDNTAHCDYDYRSLLRALWEETPEEYKQYVFHDENIGRLVRNRGKKLLSRLLQRSPFQEIDEAIFKRIVCDQPQEKRRAIMLSAEGEKMCLGLMQKERWSFVNGLLEECLSKEEIPDFKKRLIENKDYLDICKTLLYHGKIADVQRMIDFCLSSDEKKERLKVRLIQHACVSLFCKHDSEFDITEDRIWKQIDTIMVWTCDTKEKIRDFKKDLFSLKGIDIHYSLVLLDALLGRVERFYQWFGLSPEEIKQLKRDTLFAPEFIKYIHRNLPEYTYELVASLHLCLTDEEMVMNLKKEVEEYCTDILDERREMKKEQLDNLVSELLDGFRKEKVLDKTSREGIFVKDTEDKRSSVGMEDVSSSPRKQSK